ncbi:MAG: glycosyltransferase family 2 protein [Cytophagales bacterium]|nr:glycosyltransferase family 2 protein [Cytophagales bacterium]
MPTSIQLSVVIITKNEEANLKRCLPVIASFADDILVLDSGSTDGTQTVAESYGARFLVHPFTGYTDQKNKATELALFDHVLNLDADEWPDDLLLENLKAIKENWVGDGYYFNRLTNYCGTWIRHTDWYPDQQYRLFDRRKAYWGGPNLHEKLVFSDNAQLTYLKGDLLHYSFQSIAQHLSKIDHYTTLGAKIAFEQGKRASMAKILFSPVFKFIKSYFIRRGFLDGYHGFVVATLSSFASMAKYLKMKDLEREKTI